MAKNFLIFFKHIFGPADADVSRRLQVQHHSQDCLRKIRIQLTWKMWHFEILQAKDCRRVRHGQLGLSLRCTSDFHLDRFHQYNLYTGRDLCDFQDHTCTDRALMFFAAFLTRSPAKVWLCKTQLLPGDEWCCDVL